MSDSRQQQAKSRDRFWVFFGGRSFYFLGLALSALLLLSGCDSAKKTVELLQKEIAAYPLAPSPEAEASIDQNFTRLNQEIVNLRTHGKGDKAAVLQREFDSLQAQYAAARISATVQKFRGAVENFGDAVRQVGKEIDEAFGENQQQP